MSDLTAFPENTAPKAAKDGVPGAPAAPAAPAAKAAGPARSQSNETGPEPGQSGISMVPIGFIRTPYGQKFAVPRQPRLAEVECEIEFYQPYCDPQAFIGLEGFSHIHVLFLFDREEVREFRPMVLLLKKVQKPCGKNKKDRVISRSFIRCGKHITLPPI